MRQPKQRKDSIHPLSPEHEILLKRIYAFLLKGFGYKIDLKFSEIRAHKFVASGNTGTSNKPPTTPLPEVSKSTRSAYNSIYNGLFHNHLANEFMDSDYDDIFSTHEASSAVKNRASLDRMSILSVPSVLRKDNVMEIHQSFLQFTKNETLDKLMMKFLFAKHYRLDKGLEMLVKQLRWRTAKKIDDLLFHGDAQVYYSGEHPEFINSFMLDQVYVRGHDKKHNPLVIIKVKNHLRENCPDKDFERFICLVIEWVKLSLRESKGVNKSVVLFDLTDFTMKNADLAAIKFMASTFEAVYPEYVGLLLIHNAPWIFNAVWKIVKPWIDQFLVQRVRFTYKNDVLKYVDPKYLPPHLGGRDKYVLKYRKPSTDRKTLDEQFDSLVMHRNQLLQLFLQTTINWIYAETAEESHDLLMHRVQLQEDLCRNYVQLDPYIRTQSVFERDEQMSVNC